MIVERMGKWENGKMRKWEEWKNGMMEKSPEGTKYL
jgi:hypothetical protein